MSEPVHASIRHSRSIARLTHTFSESLSASDLVEPMVSLDENQSTSMGLELMRARELAVLGVRRAGLVAGWVSLEDLTDGTLGEHMREFSPESVLDEDVGLDVVLVAFGKGERVFIRWLGEVAGVITREDLQKAPLRMWLFGAITLFDLNMTWAIEELYPGDTWTDRISPGRLEKAQALCAERVRCGNPCRLVDCLQIKDKADILSRDAQNLAVLGFASRREADRYTQRIESLRNHLAHAQELDSENLATAADLATYIESIVQGRGVRQVVEKQRAGD
jgi:predicted transcriptional regulator